MSQLLNDAHSTYGRPHAHVYLIMFTPHYHASAIPLATITHLSYSPTCPLSIISTRSLSMIVFNRCAIVSTVHSENLVRIMVWIRSSVSESIEAVASSMTRIFGLRSRARPMQISCKYNSSYNTTKFIFLNVCIYQQTTK
jgi:hypothetical protein